MPPLGSCQDSTLPGKLLRLFEWVSSPPRLDPVLSVVQPYLRPEQAPVGRAKWAALSRGLLTARQLFTFTMEHIPPLLFESKVRGDALSCTSVKTIDRARWTASRVRGLDDGRANVTSWNESQPDIRRDEGQIRPMGPCRRKLMHELLEI